MMGGGPKGKGIGLKGKGKGWRGQREKERWFTVVLVEISMDLAHRTRTCASTARHEPISRSPPPTSDWFMLLLQSFVAMS